MSLSGFSRLPKLSTLAFVIGALTCSTSLRAAAAESVASPPVKNRVPSSIIPETYAAQLQLARKKNADSAQIAQLADSIIKQGREAKTKEIWRQYQFYNTNIDPTTLYPPQKAIYFMESDAAAWRSEIIVALLRYQKIDVVQARQLLQVCNPDLLRDAYLYLPAQLEEMYVRLGVIDTYPVLQKYGADYHNQHPFSADDLDLLLTDALAVQDYTVVNFISYHGNLSEKTRLRIVNLAKDIPNNPQTVLYLPAIEYALQTAFSQLAQNTDAAGTSVSAQVRKLDPLSLIASPIYTIRSMTLSQLPAPLRVMYVRLGYDGNPFIRALKNTSENTSENTFSSTELDSIVKAYQNKPNFFLYLLAARHPHASSALLTQLAKDARYEIRAAVAENPETPAEVLTRLATDPHDAVRYHTRLHPKISAAVFDAQMQKYQCASADFLINIDDISYSDAYSACRTYFLQTNTPTNIPTNTQTNISMRQVIDAILALPNTDRVMQILDLLIDNPTLSTSDLEKISQRVLAENNAMVRSNFVGHMLQHPNLTDAQAERLIAFAHRGGYTNAEYQFLYAKLDQKRPLSDEEITFLLENDNPEIRSRVAALVPPLRLRKYILLGAQTGWQDPSKQARDQENAPDALTTTLIDAYADEAIKNNWYFTKELISQHPRTTTETLAKLARDADDERFPLAFLSKKLPKALHRGSALTDALADSHDSMMRTQVYNDIDPKEAKLLQRLGSTDDLNLFDAKRVDLTLTATELDHLAHTRGAWTQQLIANHPNTGIDTLLFLAKNGTTVTRYTLLSRSSLPLEVRAILLQDRDVNVRIAATSPFDAKDLHTAKTLQIVIDNGNAQEIANFIAQNPTLIDEKTKQILQAHPSDAVRTSLLTFGVPVSKEDFRRWVNDPSAKVRAAVAVHRAAPDDVLQKLAQDGSNEVLGVLLYNQKINGSLITAALQNADKRDPSGNTTSSLLISALANTNLSNTDTDQLVAAYAKDQRAKIRHALAVSLRDTQIQSSIAKQFLSDASLQVRTAMSYRIMTAFTKNEPVVLLAASHENIEIRKNIARSVTLFDAPLQAKLRKILKNDDILSIQQTLN